jgi:Pretoxin HINT domain
VSVRGLLAPFKLAAQRLAASLGRTLTAAEEEAVAKAIIEASARGESTTLTTAALRRTIDCVDSFAPDTPVLMANGLFRPIASLRVGDWVASRNEFSLIDSAQPVTGTHVNRHTDQVLLKLGRTGGLAADDSITTTVAGEVLVGGVVEGLRVRRPVVRPGGKCFPAGTLVATARGNVAIESVQIGDLVLSRDVQTRQIVFSPVEKTFVRQAAALIVLKLEGADGRLETIKATPEHPFYVAGTGFVSAGGLTSGTRIVTLDQAHTPLYLQVASRDNDSAGALLVKSVSVDAGEQTVYNFSVAETHTYAVGILKAWVHNADYGLEKNWSPRNIANEANWNGCEQCALDIQAHIGGTVVRIAPIDTPILGGYRGRTPPWGHHEVVVKDGMVYDAFTGAKGTSIADYKALWEYPDDINFGF